MPNVQNALLFGPGRFNAACLYGSPTVTPELVCRAAARLIRYFEGGGLPDGLTVLVGLRAGLLEGRVSTIPEPSTITSIGGGNRFKVGGDSVFVQISAQCDVHRLYALRVASEILGPIMGSSTEILGARLLNGQEPFGFTDGEDGSYQKSVADAQLQDGAWLFYQRFRQNAQQFFDEKPTPLERGQVLGRAPMADHETRRNVETTLTANPIPDSHYQVMHRQPAKIVRRGFACRHDGEEGLAFVGAAPTFETFPALLTAMVAGGDRLLPYIDGRDGGIFYCPPNAAWLGGSTIEPFEPKTTGPLARAGHLISYDTTTAFYKYLMLLKANGLFDVKDLPTRISDAARPRMDDLYGALTDDPAKVQEMVAAEREAFSNAADVNADYDQYITYG